MRAPRGFSFIEIIVSIGILGVIFVAVGAIARLSPLGEVTRDQDIALTIADTELEDLRAAGYAALPASGSFAASALSALVSGTGAVAVSSFNAETKKVVATVSWQETNGSHSLSLTTLITQDGGLP